jgi:hypothetical protein
MAAQPNIKKRELDTLPPNHQAYFRDIYALTHKQAVLEWKPRSKYPCDVLPEDERIPCQLCGTPNRYIFYIMNTRNGNELNVGRECVRRFGFEFIGSIRQLEKEAIRLRNLEALTSRFSNIRPIVERWNSVLDEQEILLPFHIENPYIELGERAKVIYEEALEKGVSQELKDELHQIMLERELLVSGMRAYVKENKLRKFAPTRDIVRWIERNPEGQTTLIMLKEDGFIKWRTAHRIHHRGFARSLIAPLNSLSLPTGWTIQEFNDTGSRPIFVLAWNQNNRIKLSCAYKEFVLRFAGPIFRENENMFTLERLISISQLYGENSVHNALIHMSDLLIRRGLEVRSVDTEFDEFIVHDRKVDRFIVCPKLASFAHRHRMLVFVNDSELLVKAIEDIQRYQSYDIEQLSERQRAMLRDN